RATDGGSSAAHQRGHRSAFDTPRYGEKTSAPSAHGGALGHGGNQRWPSGLRQWSCGSPVFAARLRLRGRACGRSVDDDRLGLPRHRRYWLEQSQSRRNLGRYEVSGLLEAAALTETEREDNHAVTNPVLD